MPVTRPNASPVRFDLLDHRQHPGGCPAVQRAGHRPDRAGEAGRDIRAGGGDDPAGEGGGVHPVLGGRHPVGIDGLDLLRVRLAQPGGDEPLDDGRALRNALRRYRRLFAAGRVRRVGQDGRSGLRQLIPGLLVGDVEQRAEPASGCQQRQRGLHVHPDVAGAEGGRGGVDGQLGAELVIDQQRPDIVESDRAHQVVDVDAAVPQRPRRPGRARRWRYGTPPHPRARGRMRGRSSRCRWSVCRWSS